jgi:hypothetical protein
VLADQCCKVSMNFVFRNHAPQYGLFGTRSYYRSIRTSLIRKCLIVVANVRRSCFSPTSIWKGSSAGAWVRGLIKKTTSVSLANDQNVINQLSSLIHVCRLEQPSIPPDGSCLPQKECDRSDLVLRKSRSRIRCTPGCERHTGSGYQANGLQPGELLHLEEALRQSGHDGASETRKLRPLRNENAR